MKLEISEKALNEVRIAAIKQNTTTLRNRVNELGVAEPIVQQSGKTRIVVELPGIKDTTRAKEISYKMGTRTKGSMIGKMVRLVGEGGCYIVGTICKPFIADKYLEFLKEYNKDVNLIR